MNDDQNCDIIKSNFESKKLATLRYMSKTKRFSYDEMAYPGFVHPQAFPDRLASVATVLGLKPKPPDNCRVLELGCGDGTNIIAFANSLPNSTFVGVDLSEKQIENGNSVIKSIGLTNLKILRCDILGLNRTKFGEFDYIIAHGVYSWTPEHVRDKVLAICGEMLAAHGIAYVSYNTLPGAHLQQMARGIASYHSKDISEPKQKVTESIKFLEFLSKNFCSEEFYGKILENELAKIIRNPRGAVFHDVLEEVNAPVYFSEFVSHAEEHDLKFLSEIEYFTNRDARYPPEMREFLHQVGDDLIKREQYIDLFTNRRFRQTLLCRKELAPGWEPKKEFLKDLKISGDIRPKSENFDFEPRNVETFVCKNDNQFQIDHSLTKAALICVGEIYPRSIGFTELVEKAERLINRGDEKTGSVNERDLEILSEVLFQIFNVGLVRFCIYEPFYEISPGERPMTNKLTRWRIENGFEDVMTPHLENLKIENKLARKLLSLFDGTRTREDVLLALSQNGEFADEENLSESIENHLAKLARQGLFDR